MPDFATDIVRALGGQGNPQAIKFVQAWGRKEGGATNNAASFNWLNRTDKGFPTINKVGVVAYPNYSTGVQRTAQLIQSGYPSIATALKTGAINLQDPAQQGDLNRWVSGQRTPGATPYVQSIAGLMGQNAGVSGQPGGGVPLAPAASSTSTGQQNIGMARTMAIIDHFRAKRRGEDQGILPLIGQLMQLQQPQFDTSPTAPEQAVSGQGGNEVITSHGWKGTHITDGLDWNHGAKTAGDIMAKAGSEVGAPEDGTIIRHGSAQGGSSVYFKGKSGKTYWLGHIDGALPVGTIVRADQPIAVVSSDHPRPHVHIDVLGGQ